ncbi:DUF1674 domain-containing protein [Marinicella rhabdoformis]|uniref:DUF1674 domain-containing protein n=1 Tax=Marinicella rhabdoformis TaxID=2580566 RepID=UPI0012AED451|nr:DUF1674 domain-containing protein [Marinicella rhabdoformis]
MSENTENKSQDTIKNSDKNKDKASQKPQAENAKEYGGRKDGLDPTRFGDWEKNGRCIDF